MRTEAATIRARFDRIAPVFARAAGVYRRVADGLAERMAPLQLDPGLIIDAGAGTGEFSRRLKQRFRRAQVVSLDISAGMLREARRAQSRFARKRLVQGDVRRMPFIGDTADLITANLLLPWVGEPDATLTEFCRVLRPNAPLVFSSLGPDSFRELRAAWEAACVSENIPPFIDMHDLGDALIRSGFQDPVLDVERLTVTYTSFAKLWQELRAAGAQNPSAARRKGLTGRERFQRMEACYGERHPHQPIELTLELVYGHAWAGAGLSSAAYSGEYRVNIDEIRRRS